MRMQFPGVAGEWQTASIPFSLFMRKELIPRRRPRVIEARHRDGGWFFALLFSGSPGFDL